MRARVCPTRNILYALCRWTLSLSFFSHVGEKGARHFSEEEAQFLCAELVCAIGHLHSLEIVFRDLKPENVLLSSAGHVLLCDFGLAKPMERDASPSLRHTVCGTPIYMSPEAVRNYQRCMADFGDDVSESSSAESSSGFANDWCAFRGSRWQK
eukprot:SAG11_NODE_511_length_8847_cov_3.611911_6_plen_154_part_00